MDHPVLFWSNTDLDPTLPFQDEGTTTVTLSGLERKDCGMYKVKAKNSQGEDEVEVRVNVIGPPDKPRGPLEVRHPFLKHASSILRQSSNPICGFFRHCHVWPMENWLGSSMNHMQGWMTV